MASLITGAVVGAALVQAGCGSDPASSSGVFSKVSGPEAPPAQVLASSPPGDFYPLSIGNSWVYDRVFTFEIEIITGPPYHRRETMEGTVTRAIVGSDEISGVEYLVEESMFASPDRPDTVRQWARYRQDRAGLYVADAPLGEPPSGMGGDGRAVAAGGLPRIAAKAWREHSRKLDAIRRALSPVIAMSSPAGTRTSASAPAGVSPAGRPGGALPEEYTALSYPLHPGQTWLAREEPFVVAFEVEGRESLDLPAGRFPSYRLRVDNELLGPNDSAFIWYGRCGRLAFTARVETTALDLETGETARITTEETERLRDVSLLRASGCPEGR